MSRRRELAWEWHYESREFGSDDGAYVGSRSLRGYWSNHSGEIGERAAAEGGSNWRGISAALAMLLGCLPTVDRESNKEADSFCALRMRAGVTSKETNAEILALPARMTMRR